MRHRNAAVVKGMVPMLTTAEVSQLLHVHANTLRRWSDRGIIKTYRIGARGDRRFRQDDVAHFLSQFEASRGDLQKVLMGSQVSR